MNRVIFSARTLGLVALAFGVLASCNTVPAPPRVELLSRINRDEQPRVFVDSSMNRERIVRSIESVGIVTVSSLHEANFILRADFGMARSEGQCGTVRNIRYTISQSRTLGVDFYEAARIRARGSTGTCRQNIFDVLARRVGKLVSPNVK
jgi:hypothetical protein